MSVRDRIEGYRPHNLRVFAARVRTLRRSCRLSQEDRGLNDDEDERNGNEDNDVALKEDIRPVLLSYPPLYRQSLTTRCATAIIALWGYDENGCRARGKR